MKFADNAVGKYKEALQKKAWLPTIDRFIQQVQKGRLSERDLQDDYGFTKFDAADIIEKLKNGNNLAPNGPQNPSLIMDPDTDGFNNEYRLHANDLLFSNGLFYLDSSLSLGVRNVYPVYRNNLDKRTPLILKVYEDKKTRDAECEILDTLRHESYIVSAIEKMDFVNHQYICQ